jgi:prophage antirepressor-like protein
MSASIIPFSFEKSEVRAISDEQGEPWFVATDVAAVLGYGHVPHMTRMLDDDEKGVHILDTLGGNQELTIISESGLYACILKSRRSEAKAFRRWVTGEVLPALRKTGRYAVPTEATINPAQQRQLQNAIAGRFPDGKLRPYAWSRFNNHFALGSYKQLPASQLDAALAYIGQMPGAVDDSERERQARETLRSGRFLLTFDARGQMHLHEVPKDAFVFAAEELPRLVGDVNYPRAMLPGLLKAAADRLAA